MVRSIDWTEFIELRDKVPLVDVRSELEYQAGHIPNAINITLLNNAERIIVGTAYKQEGRRQAIKRGFELVGPRLADLIEEAERVATQGEMLVHCWRGGMRSSNFCQFAEMAGIKTSSLKGGYKSYRHQAQESFKLPLKLILISGCTGSGKSEVLRELKQLGEQVIDLEGMANHKGSAFGGLMMPPQPTTEQFENFLFEQIIKLDLRKPIWVEDESIAVGRIFLPSEFWKTMRKSPVVMLNVEKGIRVNRLVDEYGIADRAQFLEAMTKITKKLGGQHFKAAREKLEQNQMHDVMEILLTYYDKSYTGSIAKRNPEKLGEVSWDGISAKKAAQQLTELIKLQSTI